MDVYSTASGTFKPRGGEVGAASPNLGTWTSLGPGNIGGRTRAIVIDPTGRRHHLVCRGRGRRRLQDDEQRRELGSRRRQHPHQPGRDLAGPEAGHPHDDPGRNGRGLHEPQRRRGARRGRLQEHRRRRHLGAGRRHQHRELLLRQRHRLEPTGLVYAATSTGVWSWVDGVTLPGPDPASPASNGGCLDLALRPELAQATGSSPPAARTSRRGCT